MRLNDSSENISISRDLPNSKPEKNFELDEPLKTAVLNFLQQAIEDHKLTEKLSSNSNNDEKLNNNNNKNIVTKEKQYRLCDQYNIETSFERYKDYGKLDIIDKYESDRRYAYEKTKQEVLDRP